MQNAGLWFLYILAAAILFLAAPVAAQESTVSYPNGNFIWDMEIQGNYVWCATTGSLVRWNKADGTYRQYTEKDGLADYGVYSITKDAQGNLWLGTRKGAQRFDGAAFTTFNTANSGLVNNAVHAVAVAQNGVIWIGTTAGLSRFDGKTWTNYTTQNSGIPYNYINSLAVDRNGVVWLAHYEYLKYRGVSSFDGTTWKTYTTENSGLKDNSVITIAVDDKNTKWFGASLTLISFDGQTWAEHAVPYVNDMTVDSKGALWAAAGGVPSGISPPSAYSLSSYNGKSWTTYPLDAKFDRPTLAYTRVRVDADGTVWFVTQEYYGSLSLHSYNGTMVKTYLTDGPLNYSFSGIAIDSMNRKWFATYHGVSCFDGKSWVNHLFTLTTDDVGTTVNLQSTNLFANWIKGIVVDRENVVWVCSEIGHVASYDGKAWKLYTHTRDSTFVGGLTYTIVVDRNNVKWFAGIYIKSYDGKTWTNYQQYKTFAAYSGAVDNDNVKWFGTFKEGVWSFDGTTWTNYYTSNSPLKGSILSAAADQNNVKWFASNDGMIYSFDGAAWKTYGQEVTGVKYPYSLYVDRNNVLWVLHNPLISFDGKTWKTWPDIKLGSLSAIALDADGYMWVASIYSVGEGGTLSAMKLSTGPTVVAETVPVNFAITGNYPNPFNPSTTISFSLTETGRASLAVYNVTGQKVRELVSGTLPAGWHSVVWDGRDQNGKPVSSGIYISRLMMRDKVTANRMLLMK